MTILLTKKPSPQNKAALDASGHDYDLIALLKITPVEVNEIPEADGWIVSSRNAWTVVNKFIHKAPKEIYCIGEWLKNKFQEVGVKSSIQAFYNMQSLASEVNIKKEKRYIYFCGDHHRPELFERTEKIEIAKVIAYQSALTYPILQKKYDVVFVLSPRSVDSLLKHNSFTNETIFACVGPTTVSYLHEKGITNTFCASKPDNDILIKEFFIKVSN
jgi:uroporphyrinogen-III synthase